MPSSQETYEAAIELWEMGEKSNNSSQLTSSFGLMKKVWQEEKAPRLASYCAMIAYDAAIALQGKRKFDEYYSYAEQYAKKALEIDQLQFRAQFVKCQIAFDKLKQMDPNYVKSGWLTKGDDLATSIVSSTFSVVEKSIRLGIAGATVASSRSKCNQELEKLFGIYKETMSEYVIHPSEFEYITSIMLEVADVSGELNLGNPVSVYQFISELDLDNIINYDNIKEEYIEEVKKELKSLKYIAMGKTA